MILLLHERKTTLAINLFEGLTHDGEEYLQVMSLIDPGMLGLAHLDSMAAVRGRGNRFDALQAQELVQMRAEEQEPDARPYAAPYYWAGFQITGW